ncbi:conjugal transfer protein TraF [Shewanella psychrotolerans]|uniref:conjugal transfer protein TraF n=1 Tax=Shewanella psychrotolerans TaxID=2864206 RepID=UPI001C66000F|nr:conjugal transfer protein TraF [Shewanella psychrotolerans]QYK01897.1 conjugal transfer protein TraF [Shewanella psychrotolerans]
MKFLNTVFTMVLGGLSVSAFAGQQYYEARSDAMGGASVASSHREGAAFINPALLAVHAPKYSGGLVMLPALGADAANVDNLSDQFDALQLSYDGLESAIDAADAAGVESYKMALIGDLQSLEDESAYVSAGLGFSVVLPTKRMPMAVFYKTYIDAVSVAAIEQSDLDLLENIDPNSPPALTDLDSQGAVIAGAVSDLGVALSFPLSIVNMPIAVGISPKLQRIDTYNYVISANDFDAGDFDDKKYRNKETAINLDVGVAMQPLEGMVVGLSGRNLISQKVDTVESLGRQFTYRVEALYTAGVSYGWNRFSVTTDIDLNKNKRFDEIDSTQYWRVGGEIKATDWFALRLGYRHDLEDSTADIYSIGTGFTVGRSFNFDLTGMMGSDDVIGGVLQTSYHF